MSISIARKNSRSPTLGPFHYPLTLDNQLLSHSREDLRYHNIPLKRINNSLQYCKITCNRELKKIAKPTNELIFYVTGEIVELNPYPVLISTRTKHQFNWSSSHATWSHFTSTDEPQFSHQW